MGRTIGDPQGLDCERLRNWRTSEMIQLPPLEEYDETVQRKLGV
jgi:hypothetical protein